MRIGVLQSRYGRSEEDKKHITSSVYDCTVEDVENA